MPIYVFECPVHGKKEVFLTMGEAKDLQCECGAPMARAYAEECAGALPFKSYWTDALTPGKTIQINSKRQEQEHCRRLGVERVS